LNKSKSKKLSKPVVVENSFKFLDVQLNRDLARLMNKAKIAYSIDESGFINYSENDVLIVENELICSIRNKVFKRWSILICPIDLLQAHKDYMDSHHIPFKEELANGELWFLLPAKYRPLKWKLDGDSSCRNKKC